MGEAEKTDVAGEAGRAVSSATAGMAAARARAGVDEEPVSGALKVGQKKGRLTSRSIRSCDNLELQQARLLLQRHRRRIVLVAVVPMLRFCHPFRALRCARLRRRIFSTSTR